MILSKCLLACKFIGPSFVNVVLSFVTFSLAFLKNFKFASSNNCYIPTE